MLAKNQTYRAFVARPSYVLNMGGELQENALIMGQLVSEIRDISAYATYVVRNDVVLGAELAQVTAIAPSEAGRQAGVTMPDFLASGRTGKSRKEKLVQPSWRRKRSPTCPTCTTMPWLLRKTWAG